MNNKAFSLVEVVITVGVLSILTGISVISYLEYASTSKESAALQSIDALKRAVEMSEATTRKACKSGPVDKFGWLRFSGDPIDPWGNTYHINSETRVIYSFGENRSDDKGTGDDVSMEYHGLESGLSTDPPLDLIAKGKSGQIELTWNHPRRNESLEKYRIEKRIDGKTKWNLLVEEPAIMSAPPSWKDRSLESSMIYYRVIAMYSKGRESRPSALAGWVPIHE